MENAGETPEEAERKGAGYARDAGRHNRKLVAAAS